jgi:hypothetical protein
MTPTGEWKLFSSHGGTSMPVFTTTSWSLKKW